MSNYIKNKKRKKKLAVKHIAESRGVSLGVANHIYATMSKESQQKLRSMFSRVSES